MSKVPMYLRSALITSFLYPEFKKMNLTEIELVLSHINFRDSNTWPVTMRDRLKAYLKANKLIVWWEK